MDQQRQQSFQKLRPVCVQLSSVALKFRGHQASVKDVLHALIQQHDVIKSVGSQNGLDEKLAEYCFFPLTHVFRESQTLSPRCMEVAVQSITILVSQGWKSKLARNLGEQLLIFISLLAGGDPQKQSETPSDELKATAFTCLATLISWLARSSTGRAIFEDQKARNIVDQLAYMLVESLVDAVSDTVQITAADAMTQLYENVPSRVFLASLLPRTVSALVKALAPSTKARRTRKVLVKNLTLFTIVITRVLADEVVFNPNIDQIEEQALDESWFKATSAQMKTAFNQVYKLRSNEHVEVRNALFELCLVVIEQCGRALRESVSVSLETLLVLAGHTTGDETATTRIKSLVLARPELSGLLQSSFFEWSNALPRIMQGSDDRPKELMLTRIALSYDVLEQMLPEPDEVANVLCSTLVKSITASIEVSSIRSLQLVHSDMQLYPSIIGASRGQHPAFEAVLFSHQSEKDSAQALRRLVDSLQTHVSTSKIIRRVVDSIPAFASDHKIAPIWLALQLLQRGPDPGLELDDIIDFGETSGHHDISRAYLVQELYSQTKDILVDPSVYGSDQQIDYRLTALALETLVLQAQQLGEAYRTELYETLYPVLALLSSQNSILQSHAVTALNMLAPACGYASVSALLIENVDYLVNGVAWKLNTFNLSHEAPAVLNMIVRLVGAKVIPYLDDLITSIFAALDSFHGYAHWVEMLFEVLKAVVDESVKGPALTTINEAKMIATPGERKYSVSTSGDILNDLRLRNRRKITSYGSNEMVAKESAPRRPWTKEHDDPNFRPDPTEGKDIETLLREAETADEENELPAPKQPSEDDPTKPLNKSHDLLLKIAQATVPHLSSPSARVRNILLLLLKQITPLLARHENTFLPLINAVWPGVVQRLTADLARPNSTVDPHDSSDEMAYNIVAAMDVASVLCENAGDFMVSRVEQISGQLKNMYTRMWKDVEAHMIRSSSKRKQEMATNGPSAIEDTAGDKITGTVDLQLATTKAVDSTAAPKENSTSGSLMATVSTSRTSTTQMFFALVRLLTTVLTHVHLNVDHADEIFALLSPLICYPGLSGSAEDLVKNALEMHNPDAVWVLRCRRRGEDEIARGSRKVDDRMLWTGHEGNNSSNNEAPALDRALLPVIF